VWRTEKGEPWGEQELERGGRDVEGAECGETPVGEQHHEGGWACGGPGLGLD
jgi:hypothetical protein